MTRPLFEPTQPRRVATNEWGVDQLQRRPAPTSSATPGENLLFNSLETNLPTPGSASYGLYPLDLTFGGTIPDGTALGNGTPFVPSTVFDYDQDNAAVMLKADGIYIWSVFGFLASDDGALTWDTAINVVISTSPYIYSGFPLLGSFAESPASATLPDPSAGGAYAPRCVYVVNQYGLWPSLDNGGDPYAFQVWYKHNGPAGGDELSRIQVSISYFSGVWANPLGV